MVKDTEHLLQDHLQGWASRFHFDFWALHMGEIENRLRREDPDLFAALSRSEIERLESLKLLKHKVQWISGRYAVKSALFKYKAGNRLMIDVTNIDVIKGADSAPHLLQYPDIHVSITHSAPYCIGVVSEARIGIDLEAVFPPNDSLLRYFYSEAEQEQLRNFQETGADATQATVFWTRKEAVSKLLGLGMRLDFKGLDTLHDEISIPGLPGEIIHIISCTCNNFCLSVAILK